MFCPRLIFLSLALLPTSMALAKLELESPVDGAFVTQGRLPMVVKDCKTRPTLEVQTEGGARTQFFSVKAEPDVYAKRWVHALDVGDQEVARALIKVSCGKKVLRTIRHLVSGASAADIGQRVSANFMHKKTAGKLKWDWGPAIALYGMLHLTQKPHEGNRAIVHYAYDYQLHHQVNGHPEINWADRAAPALVSDYLSRHHGITIFDGTTQKVMDWIEQAPRNKIDSLDHFGTWWMSHFYPSSIWVDSLMMWGVLGSLQTENIPLRQWAAGQALLFARKLRDPDSGLYHHAYNVEKARPQPSSNVPWLRGNGWVLANLALLLEDEGIPYRAQLIELFQSLAQAARSYQMPSGLYDTLMSTPGKGYEESSGSALVAFAFFRGHHLKILNDDFLSSARRTAQALAARLRPTAHGHSMGGISGPTMPYPASIYRVIPRSRDLSYGVGALALMCSQWH